MERYKNLNRTSGVSFYEIETDRITIQFDDGMNYLYTNKSAGSSNISKMKQLAFAGKGLNSFINIHVKKLYESKWK